MTETGPITVTWAFIVGVDWIGTPHIIDHDAAAMVKAKRIATLDDIYAAWMELDRAVREFADKY